MINVEEDLKKLLESKVNSSYNELNKQGYAICGDKHVGMNLRTKLDVDRVDYFVVNCLSVEYFIRTLKGANKLYDVVNTHYTSIPIEIAKEQIKVVIKYLERWA